jgi:hypothetical protein
MPDLNDVRRIGLSLPEAIEDSPRFVSDKVSGMDEFKNRVQRRTPWWAAWVVVSLHLDSRGSELAWIGALIELRDTSTGRQSSTSSTA